MTKIMTARTSYADALAAIQALGPTHPATRINGYTVGWDEGWYSVGTQSGRFWDWSGSMSAEDAAAFVTNTESFADRIEVIEPEHLLPVPNLRKGDLVLTADDRLCVVGRIGWFNDPSPWIGDTTLRAFVWSEQWEADVPETHYSAWLALTDLVPVSPFEAEMENAYAVIGNNR